MPQLSFYPGQFEPLGIAVSYVCVCVVCVCVCVCVFVNPEFAYAITHHGSI